MTDLSNSNDLGGWSVFPHQTEEGRPVIIRSRVGEPDVREFAQASFMARARCVLTASQINEDGMPSSTESLDEWEDKVLAELGPDTRTYEIAVVTGDGRRDLFFAGIEEQELIDAISNVEGNFTFELQLARVEGPRDALLNSLTPPQ